MVFCNSCPCIIINSPRLIFTSISIHTVIENVHIWTADTSVLCWTKSQYDIKNTIICESKINKKTYRTSTDSWATQETCTYTHFKQSLMIGLSKQDVFWIRDWKLLCDLCSASFEISNDTFNGNAKMINKSRFKKQCNLMPTRQDSRQDINFWYILIISHWIHANPIRDNRNSNTHM